MFYYYWYAWLLYKRWLCSFGVLPEFRILSAYLLPPCIADNAGSQFATVVKDIALVNNDNNNILPTSETEYQSIYKCKLLSKSG